MNTNSFKSSSWLKFLFLTFLSWGLFSSSASGQVPFANKYVKIKNVHSGKNLCTMHYSKDPKSNRNQEKIIQYSFTGDPTHIWLIKPAGNNLFIIENAQTGKVLCTRHWSKDPKSNQNQERIIQYDYTGDPTHKWRFKNMRNGRWSIVNAHSGKNLCTMHYSKDPQSRKNQEEIIQYDYTGDPTHLWQMEIMSKPKKYVAFPFENKYVKIVNVHSGKNLCTMHWSKDAKSNNNQEAIIQYSYTGDPTHKWLIKPLGNDLYSIVNAHSGKNLCTMNWSKDPKSKNNQEAIIQYSYSGDPTHKWRFKNLGGGQWSIVNAHSGKNLCTMHWSKDPKSKNNQEAIIQYSYSGDPTHKWRLEIVNK